jgi:hypothetical protein
MGLQVFAQHLDSGGEVAAGWPPDGQLMVGAWNAAFAYLTPDGQGNALAVWEDRRVNGTMAVAKLSFESPSAPGWSIGGVLAQTAGTAVEVHRIVTDGMGGAFIGWCDRRSGGPSFNPFYYDIYAQHVLSTGVVDPTWPMNGLPICTAPSGQYDFDMAPDGSGGAYFLWEDFRNGFWQTFALRVNVDGSRPGGWLANGNQVSSQLTSQISPRAAADAAGGLYATWRQFPPPMFAYQIFGQHLMSDGTLAAGWAPSGNPIGVSPTGNDFTDQTVAADGFGGLLLAYNHNGPTFTRVYAQRIEVEPAVATVVSLVDARATADGVFLRWESIDAARAAFIVERRDVSSDWFAVGSPSVIARLLEFQDRGMPAGRYAYRLQYTDQSGPHTSQETWVEVASQTASLALGGFVPNPATGQVVVSFSLPDDRPASIEIHDVLGRIIRSQVVGSLGTGHHLLRLAEGDRLKAGVYWIRLNHPSSRLLAKGVVAR